MIHLLQSHALTRNTDICEINRTLSHGLALESLHIQTHTLRVWNKNRALKQTSALSMTVPKGPPSVRFKCNIYCQMRRPLLKTMFVWNAYAWVHRYACSRTCPYACFTLSVILSCAPFHTNEFSVTNMLSKKQKGNCKVKFKIKYEGTLWHKVTVMIFTVILIVL